MDTMSLLAQAFIAFLAIMIIWKLILNLTRIVNRSRAGLTASSRRLGKFEETMEFFSEQRQGTTNTCYVMILYSREKLKESLVRDALVRLAKRQPLLRAVIKIVSNFYLFGREDEKYFEIIEPSKVEEMIDLTTSDLHASQWQKAWYDIAIRPIKTSLLWQTVLFNEEYLPDSETYVNTIVFRVNHSIVDGISGMKLCNQFLSHLNRISDDPRARSEDITSLELLPSFYKILSKTWSLWKYLKQSLGLYALYKFQTMLALRGMLARKPEKPYDFFLSEPSLEPRDLMYKVFSESETLQICKACKSNGATVTGALMAVTHMAFCKIIESQSSTPSQEVAKQQKLPHLYAINCLRACEPKPPVDYLGNFLISEMLTMSYENKADFWSLAQEATKQIQSKVKEGKFVSTHLAQFDIFTPREIAEELNSPLDPKKRLKLFLGNYISSAGAFTFDDTTDSNRFKLHECLYYSIPYGFSSFSVHYNTTVNGKMSWTIICSRFVSRVVEEQFTKYCFDMLLKELHQE